MYLPYAQLDLVKHGTSLFFMKIYIVLCNTNSSNNTAPNLMLTAYSVSEIRICKLEPLSWEKLHLKYIAAHVGEVSIIIILRVSLNRICWVESSKLTK